MNSGNSETSNNIGPRQNVNFVRPFVRSSVTNANWRKSSPRQGHERESGGTRLRSQEAEIIFVSLAETLFSTPWVEWIEACSERRKCCLWIGGGSVAHIVLTASPLRVCRYAFCWRTCCNFLLPRFIDRSFRPIFLSSYCVLYANFINLDWLFFA